MNKKSRKNTKRSLHKRSRVKKYIGGENCSQYKDQETCVLHKDQCFWKFTTKKCIGNPMFKKVVDVYKPTLEQDQPTLVKISPEKVSIATEVKNEDILPKPALPAIIFQKKPVPMPNPQVQSFCDKKPKDILPSLPSRKPDLNSLPLVDPRIACNDEWPVITDVVNVPGDGHCLFHALRAGLRSLGLFNGNHLELRARIVQELRTQLKNGEDLSMPFSTAAMHEDSSVNVLRFGDYFESQFATNTSKISLAKQVKSYLDQMAAARYGTEIEIWMTSRLFNVNIDVYTLPVDPDHPIKDAKTKTYNYLESGKIYRHGEVVYVPLTCINRSYNPELPTIRLFNASGFDPNGRHYQVLPSSISIAQFESERK